MKFSVLAEFIFIKEQDLKKQCIVKVRRLRHTPDMYHVKFIEKSNHETFYQLEITQKLMLERIPEVIKEHNLSFTLKDISKKSSLTCGDCSLKIADASVEFYCKFSGLRIRGEKKCDQISDRKDPGYSKEIIYSDEYWKKVISQL